MKHIGKFRTVLSSLMYSWGGDPPPEAHWAGNELIDWIEMEFNVTINNRFDEESDDSNYENVINELELKL